MGKGSTLGKGHGVREFPFVKGSQASQIYWRSSKESRSAEWLDGNTLGIQNTQQNLQPKTGKASSLPLNKKECLYLVKTRHWGQKYIVSIVVQVSRKTPLISLLRSVPFITFVTALWKVMINEVTLLKIFREIKSKANWRTLCSKMGNKVADVNQYG